MAAHVGMQSWTRPSLYRVLVPSHATQWSAPRPVRVGTSSSRSHAWASNSVHKAAFSTFHSTQSPNKTVKKQVAFAFDIDGVLKMGEIVLPQAKRALQVLEGNNKRFERIPYIFITNGGGPSEVERAKRLTNELGVEVKPDQIIQAHTVLQSLLRRFGDEPVLIIGGPEGSREVMNDYGFSDVYTAQDIQSWAPSSWPFSHVTAEQEKNVRKADFSKVHFKAVLVFHDSRDWGRDLQFICDVLRSPDGSIGKVGNDTHEQPFLAFSHGDLVWGNEFPASRFGQGAFQHAVRAVYKEVSGRELEATTFGKPQRLTYEYANALLSEKSASESDGQDPSQERMSVWMVGDNPASDIAGANGFGWKSALVRTGVYRDETGPPAHTPTILVNDVEDAVQQALEQEWSE